MRLLHLCPAQFGATGVVGGAERYATELAKATAAFAEVRLAVFGPRAERRELARGCELRVLHNLPGLSRDNPLGPGLLRELLWAGVIHCHQHYTLLTSAAALGGRLLGRKVFSSDLGGGGRSLAAWTDISRWMRGVLTISEFSTGQLDDLSAPKRVVYAGVDTGRFRPGGEKEPGLVLFVGRLLPHKGVNYLIEGLPPGAKLKVVGRPYSPEFFAELRRLAEGKDVEFLTDADDELLPELYRRAQVFVLPSVPRLADGRDASKAELFGLVLVEAMASGTAVIGSNAFSIPEIIRDGVNGLLVPPNDSQALGAAVAQLLDSPATARAMGLAGRAIAEERFTWKAVAERCLAAYREM